MLHIGRWLCGSDALPSWRQHPRQQERACAHSNVSQLNAGERWRPMPTSMKSTTPRVDHRRLTRFRSRAADYQPQARASAPLGTCSTWFDGARADSRPAPTDCASALRHRAA